MTNSSFSFAFNRLFANIQKVLAGSEMPTRGVFSNLDSKWGEFSVSSKGRAHMASSHFS